MKKERNWFVTTCLILYMLNSSVDVLWILIDKDSFINNLPARTGFVIGFYFLLSIAEIAVTGAILYWKKWGFWAAIGVVFGNIAITLTVISGSDTWKINLYHLISIGLLYGLLQIKKNGVTAWENLE